MKRIGSGEYRFFLLPILLLVGLGHAGEALGTMRAQVDVDAAKASAKAKLVKGSLYLDAGSYARALTEFEEAYRIFPSPKIFYNIGLANLRLGQFPEALHAFDHFLSEAVDADRDSVAHAKAHVATTFPKVAVIEIVALEDAEIGVDDRSIGRAPLKDRLYLAPGRHRLVARTTTARPPITRDVDVRGGSREKFDLTPASSVVAAAPPPAVPPAPVVAQGASSASPATVPLGPAPPNDLSARSSAASSDAGLDAPVYRRPWFWAAAGGVVAAVAVTLLLTVGRSTDNPHASLGRVDVPPAD